MVSEILLLTDPALAEALMARLQAAAPSAPVRTIHSKQAFAARCQTSLEDTRVITVGTDILVPPEVLQRLPGPGYNFHPGPPEVRGRYPSCFALYAGAAMFGSTVHELAPQVDSGAIVAVDRFAIPDGADRAQLDGLSFQSLLELFDRLVPTLLRDLSPLPVLQESWSGPVYRQRDFDRLCVLEDDISEAEFQRRLRAVGEGPDHALHFKRFGRVFALRTTPAAQGQVLRAGRPV